MASEIEAYLDAFEEVQRLLKRLSAVFDQINSGAGAITGDLQGAAAMVPSDWPTRGQLRGLLSEIAPSQEQLLQKWSAGPHPTRNAIPNKRPDAVSDDGDEEDVDYPPIPRRYSAPTATIRRVRSTTPAGVA